MAKLIYRVEMSDSLRRKVINKLKQSRYTEHYIEEIRQLPFGPYQSYSWLNRELYNYFITLQQTNKHEDYCWYSAFERNSWNRSHRDTYERLRSGCFLKKSLRQWFSDSLEHLHNNGFVLSTYEINGLVEHSKKSLQIRFDRNDATFVRREPLIT